jgi:hypothetical protein
VGLVRCYSIVLFQPIHYDVWVYQQLPKLICTLEGVSRTCRAASNLSEAELLDTQPGPVFDATVSYRLEIIDLMIYHAVHLYLM